MGKETGVLNAGKYEYLPQAPLTMFQTWKMALTRPSVATFEDIARDPNATTRRAYKWIFFANLVGDVLSLSVEYSRDPSSSEINCFLPLGAVVTLIITIIYASIIHWIATKVGGLGTYNKLIYAFAASLAPIALISTAVIFLPSIQYLVIPLFVYGIVLNILAVRAVHQLGWKKATASTLTPILLWIIVIAITVGIFLVIWSNLETTRMTNEEDYTTLIAALDQRWENDESLPNTSVGFDTINQTEYTDYQVPGYWLVIEMQYTGACDSTPSDPCNKLANEFAQIVFDNYRKVNEIAGIKVVIGEQPFNLFIEPADIKFQKSLTTDEWREELSVER